MLSEHIYQHELDLAHGLLTLTTRRAEFLELMSWHLYEPHIDWECYWAWFYHSAVSAEMAYENSME